LSSVIKTEHPRCVVHRNLIYPDWVVAKIQVSKGAKECEDGKQGPRPKTTQKNLVEITYFQTGFDEAEVRRQIADNRKAAAARRR
jgi:hypothetical protein